MENEYFGPSSHLLLANEMLKFNLPELSISDRLTCSVGLSEEDMSGMIQPWKVNSSARTLVDDTPRIYTLRMEVDKSDKK